LEILGQMTLAVEVEALSEKLKGLSWEGEPLKIRVDFLEIGRIRRVIDAKLISFDIELQPNS
jgi:hypothetical protein